MTRRARTYRFSADELRLTVRRRPDLFRLPEEQQSELLHATDEINFAVLINWLEPYLTEQFAARWNPDRDLIIVPVPVDQQVELGAASPGAKVYRGPETETVGFLVHDLSEDEYAALAIRVMQTARLLIDRGKPLYRRTSSGYYRLLAEEEFRALQEQARRAGEDARRREYIRRHIGELLGVYNRQTGQFDGQAEWAREIRRYGHVVRNGEFIAKIRPVVQRINEDLQIAGFCPPSPLDRPGIHFQTDLQDVEIVLPRPMLHEFLAEADRLERRMAEDQIIGVEAVRLTDRDLLRGALGARLNASFQGVHNVETDRNRQQSLAEYGVNSLVAVANRQLQVANLRGIESGRLPAGSEPILLPTLTLPLTAQTERVTTLGNSISVGSVVPHDVGKSFLRFRASRAEVSQF